MWTNRALKAGAIPAQQTQAAPAGPPEPDTCLEPDSLLARLVGLARAAEQAAGDDPAATPEPFDMNALCRAHAEVVDVLAAITHAARMIELGICVASQLAAIDLLSTDLDAAWARWYLACLRATGELPPPGDG